MGTNYQNMRYIVTMAAGIIAVAIAVILLLSPATSDQDRSKVDSVQSRAACLVGFLSKANTDNKAAVPGPAGPVQTRAMAVVNVYNEPTQNQTKNDHVPGELLVKINDPQTAASFLGSHGLSLVSDIGDGTYRVSFSDKTSINNKIAEIRQDTRAAFTEPNYIRRTTLNPDDPAFISQQWGPQKIVAPIAWDVTTGDPGVIVAVVDTGVAYNHPELNGRVINGFDFVNDDIDSLDDEGHGTHVAGIIAAAGNNGVGMTGIAWNTKIMAVKVLDSNGNGFDSDVSSGIRYAADHGAKIINLSFAGSAVSQTLQNAVTYAYNKGAIVIAAAGNNGNSQINYPAGFVNVVGVGSTGKTDVKSTFSNYNSTVDVTAPGEGIYSTYLSPDYALMSGTSMATPHVSGLAALLKAKHPDWTALQIEEHIESTADDKGATGRDNLYGWGRINAKSAIAPTSSASNNGPKNEGQAVIVTISHTDPGSEIFTYSFDWNNDGIYEIVDQPGASAGHTWMDNGAYTVGVRVRDVDGSIGTTTSIVIINDLAPTANFIFSPATQTEGAGVNFTDLSISDPDTITARSWEFGDGTSSTLRNPDHTFDKGTYAVSLTVTDEDGSIDIVTQFVTIANTAPLVDAGSDQIANEGDIVTFTGTFTDAGTSVAHIFSWDFGDGSPAVTDSLTPTHIYADDGSYTVTLSVTDDDGGLGTDTLTATINNVAPSASAANDSPKNEGEAVTVTASRADPGDDTFTYSFDWDNDGIFEIVDQVSPAAGHTWTDSGTYTVGVRVKDDNGGEGTATTVVTIRDTKAPIIIITGVAAGAGVNSAKPTISAGYSDLGSGIDISTTRLYLDGVDKTALAVVTGTSVSFVPVGSLAAGLHTVIVEVTDKAGNKGSLTWSFTVLKGKLKLTKKRVYWASYSDYFKGIRSVDFNVANTGTGDAYNAQITKVTASNGVKFVTKQPTNIGTVAAGTSTKLTLKLKIRKGVTRFKLIIRLSFVDGDGNMRYLYYKFKRLYI